MFVVEEEAMESLSTDERWKLVERIVATEPFRRSVRFRDLLRYLVERTLQGHPEDLTETRIGHAVFAKASDYSPTEDSTVRVHVRQLRLKLHEYFDMIGRDEAIIVEIPKGGFVPVFRDSHRQTQPVPALVEAVQVEPSATARHTPRHWLVAFLMSLVFLLGAIVAILLTRAHSATVAATPPWPFSSISASSGTTVIVTADANYGMLELLHERHQSLQEYLSPHVPDSLRSGGLGAGERDLIGYINQSSLTSSADAVIAAKLANTIGNFNRQVSVRSARDMRPRDLDDGNFIYLGGPWSNPWVSEFQDDLNFEEVADTFWIHSWKNKLPRAGEQALYAEQLVQTGTTGDDYADIALLPNRSGHGTSLLLQGGQQEGTESTLTYLVSNKGREELMKSLGLSAPPSTPIYFEVLIRTHVIAGAPGVTEIVATRILHPRR